MITVEELIIQSLFYRLTVLRVKKQTASDSASTNINDENEKPAALHTQENSMHMKFY